MEINKLLLHPYIRLIFLLGCIIGTILINNSIWLLLFYSSIIFPSTVLNGQIKKHLNLLLFGMLPIFLSFILLYIIVLKANNGSWDFIIVKMLKLVICTSTLQLTLLIPSENLISTFKTWGLKNEMMITVLGAFTVWADVKYRADKIITARFSRGFIGKRTVFNKIKQFPFVLVPLIIGIIRTSTERAESWEQKNILKLVQKFSPPQLKYPIFINTFLFSVSLFWFVLGILCKINLAHV